MATYYLKQSPIIAAHRGLSSIYPENSIAGFMAAFEWADFAEMDVVLNKENELIVCHDPFLSLVSDIAQHPEFKDRKSERKLNQELKEDWWIADFTLEELKSLRIKQCILKRKSEFDYLYTLPTLKETLGELIQYNREHNTKKGVLLEIKDDVYHQEYSNQLIAQLVLKQLNAIDLDSVEKCQHVLPIVLMGFDIPVLKFCRQHCNLPTALLMWSEDKNLPQLCDVKEYATIIGVDLQLLWNRETKQQTDLVAEARKYGLPIYGWTFQDDCEDMLKLFESYDAKSIYKICNFLDGIITEFPHEIHDYS